MGSSVTILEALPVDSRGLRHRSRERRWPFVQEARHRHSHRREDHRAHAEEGCDDHRRSMAPTSVERRHGRHVGRPSPAHRGSARPRERASDRRARLRRRRRLHAHGRSQRLRRRRRRRGHAPARPRRIRRSDRHDQDASSANPRCRSTTTACRGPSTRTPRSRSVGLTEAAAKEKGYDVVVKKDPFGGNSRAQIIGDTEGIVKIIAEKRADGSGGQILGVHMAGPWVTEQLGAGYYAVNWEATAEEAARLDPAAPVAVRDLRRDAPGARRAWVAPCLTSRFPRWVSRSPKESSPSGLRRWVTSSLATNRSLKCRPTRSTRRCPHQPREYSSRFSRAKETPSRQDLASP